MKRCDQTDPESRTREIRMSGSMRGEVETRNRQLRSVQSASSHYAYSTKQVRDNLRGVRWATGEVTYGNDGDSLFAPDGRRIGQILLPEICANLCFGGPRRNRLFMCASQSLYAVYVETQGAHIA